ncbi:MAG: pyridoxal phosphate-dependent aminotransferase [Spirochaetales bacterium]|nr:pyridoxal phosphate-dependent aminotransferase [Spirochaetales bacterium]
MKEFKKSYKLDNVCYDIRGPVMEAAERLEKEGHSIIKLNTGNPAHFGFSPPENMKQNIINNMERTEAYVASQGIASAREVILEDFLAKGFSGIDIDDIYLGNGVSELISMAVTALVNGGDEVLIPSPDYPLWTATVTLAGGKAVHYKCDESSDWQPDLKDLESHISDRTRAIVIINPNNPTGAVYSKSVIEGFIALARKYDLILLSDEIYDRILYDGDTHYSPAVLADDVFTITFNGLSKVYLAAGYRSGWMVLTGSRARTRDYREGLGILANMRLCGNTFAQLAIEAGFSEGIAAIGRLIEPAGRLHTQRNAIYDGISKIPGISCVKPKGALYLFPKLDGGQFNISDDEKFVLDFLMEKKILLVHGRGFNWNAPDHFRIVFLPPMEELLHVVEAMGDFLEGYRQK